MFRSLWSMIGPGLIAALLALVPAGAARAQYPYWAGHRPIARQSRPIYLGQFQRCFYVANMRVVSGELVLDVVARGNFYYPPFDAVLYISGSPYQNTAHSPVVLNHVRWYRGQRGRAVVHLEGAIPEDTRIVGIQFVYGNYNYD